MTKEILKQKLIDRQGKTAMPGEISRALKEYTNFLPENASVDERKFCLFHNYTQILLCEFSGKKIRFLDHTKQYASHSEEYYRYVQYDSRTKSKWLSWENLFKANLPLNLAEERLKSKYYQTIRLVISLEEFNEESILNILIADNFNKEYAKEIIDNCDISDYRSIDEFIEKIMRAKTIKNSKLEHYLFH